MRRWWTPLLVLALSLPAVADVDVIDLEGVRLRGELAAIDAKAGTITLTVDGTPRVLVLDRLVEIVNRGQGVAGTVDVEVELRTGELVRGALQKSTSETELTLQSSVGRFSVDLDAFVAPQWIRFVGEGIVVPTDLEGVDPTRDALFGRDGRLIAHGDVDGFSGDKVLLVSAAAGEITRAFNTLGAIRFARQQVEAADTVGLRAIVEGVDGSVLVGRIDGLAAGLITLRSISGRQMSVPLAGVSKISLSGGGFDYLSDLTPTAVDEIPHLFDPKVRRQPGDGAAIENYHVDRAYPGDRPLRLGGATHRKGLGLHSWVAVHYALAGQYRRLTGRVGIDDAVMELAGDVVERGSVVIRVLVDGAEKARYPEKGFLAGGDEPLDVRVDVRDAKTLTLVVDYAANPDPPAYADTHIRDRVAFVSPRLVK